MLWLVIAKNVEDAKAKTVEEWRKQEYDDQTEEEFASRLFERENIYLAHVIDEKNDNTNPIMLGMYSGDAFFDFNKL